MPGENIQDWSVTALSNGSADSSINWREQQARSSVNDSARGMMAAIAKDRNLKNGSIVTAGTANAQTFASGIGYSGAVPAGLRVLIKIGPGLTNDAAATLSMDGITAAPIKTLTGTDVGPGSLLEGSYADLLFDGANWILLSAVGGGTALAAGRLIHLTPTTLKFSPWNGDRIRINGATYAIPPTSMTITNTGVMVDEIAGQSLAVSTTYLVTVFNDGGSLNVAFWDASAMQHAPSITSGNVGTEVPFDGTIYHDDHTLIGILATDSGGLFRSLPAQRITRSWFNRSDRVLIGAPVTTTASPSGAFVFLGSLIEFVVFKDETVYLNASGFSDNANLNANFHSVWFDGGAAGEPSYNTGRGIGLYLPFTAQHGVQLTEGYHSGGLAAYTNAGTANVFGAAYAAVGGG